MYLQRRKQIYVFIILIMLFITCIIVVSNEKTPKAITYYIQQKQPDNSEDIIIDKSVNEYAGRFPDIVQTDNGLIAAYYWNNMHAPYNLTDSLGSIRFIRGTSDGKQWDSESVDFINKQFLISNGLGLWKDEEKFYYSQDEAIANNAEFCIEARDPNFAVMGDKILFTFFTRLPWDSGFGGNTYYKYSEDYDYTYGRTYIMYSEDNGNTWSSPVEVECGYLDRGCAKRGNIAVLDENTILIPCYGYNHDLEDTFTTANIRAVLKEGEWKFEEEYSTHQEQGITVNGAFEAEVTEVSFVTVGKRVYALCRSNGDVLVSDDSGKSWGKVETKGVENLILHQPSLQMISESKQILASWAEPNGIGGRDIYLYLFNPNKDKIWNYYDKYCIYKNENAGDMADPTSIFLSDNSVLTIYYDVQKGIVGCTKTNLIENR